MEVIALPPETRASHIAEKLLLLTEALFDAVANDRLDEMSGILQSRQSVLNELEQIQLDVPAFAVLQRVAESEEAVLAVMERTSASTTQEMVLMFSGAKNLRAYSLPSQAHFNRAS